MLYELLLDPLAKSAAAEDTSGVISLLRRTRGGGLLLCMGGKRLWEELLNGGRGGRCDCIIGSELIDGSCVVDLLLVL